MSAELHCCSHKLAVYIGPGHVEHALFTELDAQADMAMMIFSTLLMLTCQWKQCAAEDLTLLWAVAMQALYACCMLYKFEACISSRIPTLV